jgi:hypothetical protein
MRNASLSRGASVACGSYRKDGKTPAQRSFRMHALPSASVTFTDVRICMLSPEKHNAANAFLGLQAVYILALLLSLQRRDGVSKAERG